MFIGGPVLASVWEAPGYVFVYAFHREIISTPFQLAACVAGIVALCWTLIAAGRAYELAGIPDLVIADELVSDAEHFRLRLLSKRKDFQTKVRLMDIVASDLTPLVPGRFPLELEWTHHPGKSDVQLTAGFEESVSVAALRPKAFAWADLAFSGANHYGEDVNLQLGESAYFRLAIQHPRKPIERWFRFERLSDFRFETFPEAPPLLTLQANLAKPERLVIPDSTLEAQAGKGKRGRSGSRKGRKARH